jgi:hypothetical protein
LTKQTSVNEAITPQSILKRFEHYNKFIDNIRKQNLEAGLDVKRNNNFVSQNKLLKQGVYEEFIQKTTNPKTGQWYTIDSLKAAGVISELDAEQFPSRENPYFRLNRITRIKNPSGEWLQFNYTIYALTKEGNAITRGISDADYYYRPQVEYRYVPEDPSSPDGKQIHVALVRNAGWGHEPTSGIKTQLVPYSKEKISQTIEAIPPIGPYTDHINGCGLSLIKEGETNKTISVTSLEEFTSDFEEVWDKYRGKNANVLMALKELASELSKQSVAAGEVYQ